jgi:hypothetical protein
MEKRPVSDGNAGSTTTSADPDLFRGALVLVAAAAGLVWAIAPHGSSEDARNKLELKSQPDTPKHSK